MNPCHAKSLYPLPCLCFRGSQGVRVRVLVIVIVTVIVIVKVKSKTPVGVSVFIKVPGIPTVIPFVTGLS